MENDFQEISADCDVIKDRLTSAEIDFDSRKSSLEAQLALLKLKYQRLKTQFEQQMLVNSGANIT